MDIIEFLQPVLEKRTEEIMNGILKGETGEDYKQFIMLIRSFNPEVRNDLENYYLNSIREAIMVSYEKGIVEASELRKLL